MNGPNIPYTIISKYDHKGIDSELLVGDFKDLIQEISCAICLGIVFNPVSCKTCSCLFCKICIDDWLARGKDKKCPMKCDFEEVTLHKTTKNLLNRIKMNCINMSLGCGNIISYENFLTHVSNECDFVICECNGCKMKVNKKLMIMHIKMCDGLDDQCPYCNASIQRRLIEKHKAICDQKDITCDKCYNVIKYLEWPRHEETCKNKVECNFCKVKYYNVPESNNHPKEECIENVCGIYAEKIRNYQLQNAKLQNDYEDVMNKLSLMEKENSELKVKLGEQLNKPSINYYENSGGGKKGNYHHDKNPFSGQNNNNYYNNNQQHHHHNKHQPKFGNNFSNNNNPGINNNIGNSNVFSNPNVRPNSNVFSSIPKQNNPNSNPFADRNNNTNFQNPEVNSSFMKFGQNQNSNVRGGNNTTNIFSTPNVNNNNSNNNGNESGNGNLFSKMFGL
jgi:hypothetical protein